MSSYRRKPNRLPGYDYSQPGDDFVTLCTEHRRPLFGQVVNGVMEQNEIGDMIHEQWHALPAACPGIELDAFMLMPDHLHGVITLGTDANAVIHPRLGDVVGRFKGRSTHQYIMNIRERGWPALEERLWQLQFHDRIVRSARELERIREYIEANPARWDMRARDDMSL